MDRVQRVDEAKSRRFHSLPPECSFTMQQWLYRRTSHTRRYKRCYIVLHKDRLYSFRKPPSFNECVPANLVESLRHATSSWMIAGAEIKADSQPVGGLYKWKLKVKTLRRYVGDNNTVFNTVLSKLPEDDCMSVDYSAVDDIFRGINETNHVSEANIGSYTDDHTVWLATSNHKVATDWLSAILWTARYGSLQNFVYQNVVRSKYLSFALPTYLMPFDYFPKSANMDTNPKRTAAFTFMKLNVKELLHIPMLENERICCVIEYNSSFYVLNLPQVYQGEPMEVHKGASNLSNIEEDAHECQFDDDQIQVIRDHGNSKLADQLQMSQNSRELSQGKHIAKKISGILGRNDTNMSAELVEDEKVKLKPTSSIQASPQGQGYNVLSILWNLNKTSDKRKTVVGKYSIYYGDDAYIYIPLYKNASQDMVWLHFVTASDMYIGSASLANSDFSITEPVAVKTCVLKNIEAINPLNHKRVDISDHPQQTSAVRTSLVNESIPDAGLVVISVVTPKHFGNFMDPVTLSYHSPQEYLSKATKASTAGGLHMLTANIRRGMAAYRTTKTLRRYVKSVLQFRNTWVSYFWMLYIIMALVVYPDKLLLFTIMPLIYYSVSSHPYSRQWFMDILLKYPILTAFLPGKYINSFLSLPKPACMACSKRKTFLVKNSHKSEEEVNKQSIASQRIPVANRKGRLALRRGEGGGGGVNREQVVFIESSDTPMLTSKHAMNSYVSYTAYAGTHIERCNHRGVIQSYLASLFLNQLKGSAALSKLKKADSRRIIRGFHSIFYAPPPYPWGVVPLLQNGILTIKYYLMLALLTFSGGIGNIQTLHLLHRIRVSKKLIIESCSLDPGDADEDQHESPRQESGDTSEGLLTEWYENERKSIFGVFSKDNLRFYDIPWLTAEDGAGVNVPEILIYNSKVVVTKDTDSNGWMYARNWNSPWTKEQSLITFVRRRKVVIAHREATHASKDLFVRKLIHSSSMLGTSFMTAKSGTNRQSTSTMKPEKLGTNVSYIGLRKPNASDANRMKSPSYMSVNTGATHHDVRIEKSSSVKGNSSESLMKKIFGAISDGASIERRDVQKQSSADAPLLMKQGTPTLQQGKLNVRGFLKKGLTILKRESPDITSTASSPSANIISTKTSNEGGFGFRKWKIFKQRGNDLSNEMILDITPESPISTPQTNEPDEREEDEIKSISDAAEIEESPESSEDEHWLTDNEEEVGEEEPKTKKRTIFNNIVAFVCVMPFCLILDIFKFTFKMIWTFLSMILWFFGISYEEAEYNTLPDERLSRQSPLEWQPMETRCAMVLHGNQYAFEIKKVKARCFMGKAKLRIYNAAKGRKSRLHIFLHPRQHRHTNLMFLYTRQYNMIHMDPEDDYYETFSVTSDYDENMGEEQKDSEMRSAMPTQLSADSESERSFSDSNVNDNMGHQIPLESDAIELEMHSLRLEEPSDGDESDTNQHLIHRNVAVESQQRRTRLYSYIKNIYARKIMKHHAEDGDFAELATEGTKQSSDYEGVESSDDMKTEHKIGVLGMLRKAKDQIIVANYYINLFTMRYEKFLNMFVWRHATVTQVLLVMFVALGLMNYFVSVNILLVIYILLYFKSGYASRMWEQNILHTVKRHLDGCLADMEIYRPFWDLTNRQVAELTKAIKRFSQVEVSSTQIRESLNQWDLARAITADIIEQKMCREWEHRSWFINIFRQSPNLMES